MFLEEYMNIYIWNKIVYIQNLYDKMAWPASTIAYF